MKKLISIILTGVLAICLFPFLSNTAAYASGS